MGAYYLMKLRKSNFGTFEGAKLYTCSTCINDSFIDAWSLSWTESGKKVNDETKSSFNINEMQIINIQKWADQKFEEEKIGWISTFTDLKTLIEYKNLFFPKDCAEILSINFPETETEELLSFFNSEESSFQEIGLSNNLNNRILENENDITIGYDLIGIEESGDFHSFHCHNLATELSEKFEIEINEFGLIKENNQWQEMVTFMNDENNGFASAPWFYVKVKKSGLDL